MGNVWVMAAVWVGLASTRKRKRNLGGSMTEKRQNAYFRKLPVGYDGSPQSLGSERDDNPC